MRKRLQKPILKRFALQLLSVFVFTIFSPQLVDASNDLSLQSVKISINVKNTSLSSARVNFNASNLFTLTKYKGIDPETRGSFGYPSARRYNFSISFNF